jgi:hypothetical protein
VRRAARITHDEVTRMVKAVRDLGLPIGRVVFNGSELSVVIGGDSGERPLAAAIQDNDETALIREPKL